MMKLLALLVLFTFLISSVQPSPARLSQLETVQQSPPANDDQQQQQVAAPAGEDGQSDSDSDQTDEEADSDDGQSVVENPSNGKPAQLQSCCPAGFKQFEANCYIGIENPPLAFNNVQQECAKLGADFASIHSHAEYAWVKKNYDLNEFWLGVVSYPDGHHENEDGTDNDFQAFDDPIWDEIEKHPYICKKQAECAAQN